MDEQLAILQLKNGDIGGLEYLTARYQVKAMRTAYLITRDEALAEDIVQDAFMRAYRAIHGFDAARPFEPWFLRSVINASIKAAGRSIKQLSIEANDDETLLAGLAARVESLEAQVESRTVQEELWDAMQKLSPRQRAVIVQRYYLDMSIAEMAQDAGTASGTIKWLLNAARTQLRRLLVRSDL